jgi:uracil-DNA glycosylase
VTSWNIVPWYVGTTEKNRSVTPGDIAEALAYLDRLLMLLPDLRVLFTVGQAATNGWNTYQAARGATDLRVLKCPHPSPQNVNTRPAARGQILATLKEVQATIAPMAPANDTAAGSKDRY